MGAGHVHLPDREASDQRVRQGAQGSVLAFKRHGLLRSSGHHPAEHSLNIDFLNLDAGAPSRVAVELDPASARELARAILETLEAVGQG